VQNHWLNWLLAFVPISLALALLGVSPAAVFVTSSLAIIPLAGMIGTATEELSLRAGPRVGGLLNATFGNITEVIIAILLISAGEFEVVKASLIGSIIGNLVLVLGASFLAGGLRFKEQGFNARSASVHAGSLMLAVTGLLMPALFVNNAGHATVFQREFVSTSVAAVLILLYLSALVFTLLTHQHLFHVPDPTAQEPVWSTRRALFVLLLSAVVVGVESELLTRSLEPTIALLGVSPIFIGLFVIAIVGNAAEHASAVFFALKNRMDIAIEIAFGSSTQIALFVAPLLVFISLALARPMDFIFLPFEVIAVALSTVVVAVLTLDGRSNWLEGVQLVGAYVIMGVSFFFVTLPR
jgi:Ca2+:H+ antiporter